MLRATSGFVEETRAIKEINIKSEDAYLKISYMIEITETSKNSILFWIN